MERAVRPWEQRSASEPTPEDYAAAIHRVLPDLGVGLEADQVQQLATHCATLHLFNPRLNLTALRTVQELIGELVCDSLLLLRLEARLQTTHVVDIGSGGGFPGLPLAIARPEWQVELLERKTSIALFLEEAVRRCRAMNAAVLNIPLEQYPMANADGRLLFTAKAVFHVEQYCQLLERYAPKNAQAAYWGTPTLDPLSLPEGWQVLAQTTVELPHVHRPSAVYLLSRE
ncbi:MAG TPA: RsmG family class I SAM-dependent methyltransferase [bacterium]|nr:RsmG family class I SAM-dependent methyltransferase [bacterium]